MRGAREGERDKSHREGQGSVRGNGVREREEGEGDREREREEWEGDRKRGRGGR